MQPRSRRWYENAQRAPGSVILSVLCTDNKNVSDLILISQVSYKCTGGDIMSIVFLMNMLDMII